MEYPVKGCLLSSFRTTSAQRARLGSSISGVNSMKIITPVSSDDIRRLQVGDSIEIHGSIYTARDAVLPRLVKAMETGELANLPVNLEGAVIFHTAVSPAGIGPTTSNKVEIEGTMAALSRAGVRIHLGKGALSPGTVQELKELGAIFVVTPPVTALFMAKIKSQRVVAFPEEGMEAMHELVVEGIPGIVAVAHGRSIF